jgi:hypothetical protein
MATITIPDIVRTFNPEGAQRPVIGSWTIAADGNTSGDYKVLGILPKNAIPDATRSRVHINTAFDGTTPGIKVHLVPLSTAEVPTNAIITTTVTAAGTTGIKYGTAAEFKTAGFFAPLSEPHAVMVEFTAGAADATAGDCEVVIHFDHDLKSAAE